MRRYLSRTPVRGKRVLLRVDFNVPIVGRTVQDDFRIRASLPTIRRLLRSRNAVILLSHHSARHQTLAPLALFLARRLGEPVAFVRNPFRRAAWQRFPRPRRRIVLVENLRFWRGEEEERPAFAKALARIGDVFVNDAFGAAHRRAASLTLLPRFLPSRLGPLFAEELERLGEVLHRPRRPFVAIVGGAKIETKLPLLRRFSSLADSILVGSAIAGALARRRLKSFPTAKVILPVDVLVAAGESRRISAVRRIGAIRKSDAVYDIGPQSRAIFAKIVSRARTIVWNGPLGLIELRAFSHGTRAIAEAIGRTNARVYLGGGDTVAFLERARLLKNFRHVSTGGGAMLAYLAGEKLPALEALKHSRL